MPKAPRANGSSAPKKRTRKAVTEAAIPVEQPATTSPEVTIESQSLTSVEERIRARAYELYLKRNGHGGSPEQDWLQAQQEVSAQLGIS